MIKQLGHYVIPSMFEEELSDWKKIDITDIMGDFSELIDELKIEGVYLGDGFDWQEEEGIIDLELYIENYFQGNSGSFYVTWTEPEYKCSYIWFNSYDGEEYKKWKNK